MARKTKEEVIEEFRCDSIRDAAMRVIARKGIDDMTVQDVADEAGIAKGTLYVYFRDREDLLAKTADRAFENLIAELEPSFLSGGSFADLLRTLVTAQLRFFDEHRALFRATLALSQRAADAHKPRTRSYAAYAERLEKMFTDAAARGEMRPLDPLAVAAVYRDCVRGVILRRLDQKKSKTTVEQDADFIVSLLLHGIDSKGIRSGEK